MKRLRLRVGPEDSGQRLDKFLAARSGLSRGACRRAIGEGGVWLDGHRIRKLSLAVESGRTLEIVIDERPTTALAEPRVLFEDRAILVIDKPAGLPTQGTLASDQHSALAWAQRLRGPEVRTVHRLDIGTSGVLVLAKTARAATELAAQFKEGGVAKRYLAVCAGTLPASAGTFSQRLRPARRRGAFEVTVTGGVPAETSYRVLASQPPLLIVEARPATGRTHQIRVHLAAAGAPLLGDSRYGGPAALQAQAYRAVASRPLLHAAEIALLHPQSRTLVTFRATPPADFMAILDQLSVQA